LIRLLLDVYLDWQEFVLVTLGRGLFLDKTFNAPDKEF